MAIAAQFEEIADPGLRRREGRLRLRLETLGETASGGAARVFVHNVSENGMLLESPVELAVGETISIDLPHAGLCAARVIWASEHLFGCHFDAPISQATLSAAQLRSAVSLPASPDAALPPDALPPAALPPAASLAQRLRQLRQERGLTLEQVAAKLGVSKPTVWAWEQGKARPVASRIEALAEVLGVTRAQLAAPRAFSSSGDLIARSRAQLAEALGLEPAQVRIMIEL